MISMEDLDIRLRKLEKQSTEDLELLEEAREHIKRLRSDLSATNTVLFALFDSMSGEQRQAAMDSMLRQMTLRQKHVETLTDPAMQVIAERIEAATERMWKALQEAHKQRKSV